MMPGKIVRFCSLGGRLSHSVWLCLVLLLSAPLAAVDGGGDDAAELKVLEALATRLDQAFDKAWQGLLQAGREPELIPLFAARDVQALEALGERLGQDIPHALKLRLFPAGVYLELDPSADPPFIFTSIRMLQDMLDKNADTSGPEFILPGSERAHIVLAHTVRDTNGEAQGMLHLSLDTKLVSGPLDQSELQGYLELRRSSGEGRDVMVSRGAKPEEIANITPSRTVELKTGNWKLYYWMPNLSSGDFRQATQLGAGAMQSLLKFIAAGVLLLLLGLGARWYLRFRSGQKAGIKTATGAGERSLLPEDRMLYQGAVRDIMEGRVPWANRYFPQFGHSEVGMSEYSEYGAGPDMAMGQGTIDTEGETIDAAHALFMDGEETTIDTESETLDISAASLDHEEGQGGGKSLGDATAPTGSPPPSVTPDPLIFRMYDIRGVVEKNFDADVVEHLGMAIGSTALACMNQQIVVARDGRNSSPELVVALIRGLRSTGIGVIDIGMVPTPVLYFSVTQLEVGSGVMLTGSHNDPEYNGLKVVIDGQTLFGEDIQGLLRKVQDMDYLIGGVGKLTTQDTVPDYLRKISEDIPVVLSDTKRVVVDAGHGVAGPLVVRLLQALGHEVLQLHCEVDGNFPSHLPDPSQQENLQELADTVQEVHADVGFALDGDGDRLGLVDSSGKIIWPDRQLMLLAQDVLESNPGATILYDVKCSRYLHQFITDAGGKPVMWKTGHSLIKNKMHETEALLAGEMSGHFFFGGERWYGFDDALYATARMMERFMKEKDRSTEEIFSALPEGVATPELRIPLAEQKHSEMMQACAEQMKTVFEDARIIDVDGLRVELPDGWGLIRPSNTSAFLILRFESDNEKGLHHIQEKFRELLLAIDPALELPF